MKFTHLHVHTEFSLLDGACRIDKLMPYLKELGQTSVAITDHGVMYGIIEFYKAAKKHGIKPIIGCEVYVAKRGRFDKVSEYDRENYHLVLLCKNNEGYQNLIKLCSLGFTEGFYGKPRIDHELLKQYSSGLIALSACLAGEIPRSLMRDDYEKAKETALFYNEIFGQDNFYLELQNHGIKEQLQINPQIIKLSNEIGIPLVATNDAHYIKQEDSIMQKTLLCIQLNQTVDEDTGMEFGTDDFYIKSAEEMYKLFGHVKGACENTNIIADRCNVEFEFGVTKLPFFKLPNGINNEEYFAEQCLEGLHKKYGANAPKVVYERLQYELDTINKMGYVDYFLIVSDFVNFAKSKGISVGPGRGSGAGSLCAYCIGITGIDPIKYNLLFERFLNPERVSMPDFDIDFCYIRRQEVINYCINKYGADHVAQIVTFGTLAARGAIRDVGRATGVPYSICDTTAKLVPFAGHIDLESAMTQSNELKALYDNDKQIHDLIDMAQAVEGMPRHASTHSAGVVITREPVNHYVPLAKNDVAIVTQLPMTTLEELGLLKMDFLGLRTLTVISDTVKMLAKRGIIIDIENIDLDDKNVYKLLSSGQTEGVFQYESDGMKSVLMRLKPEYFEDLIAVISLYRPGPMDSIPKYIFGRHNPDKIEMSTPKLQSILSVTYGCIVYQEQVMQIFRELAGYSYGHADIVRRAISKKKKDVLEKERQNFVDGTAKNGIDSSTAITIFNEISAFASYAFNKSHAAAYALISYQTAYLKHYYVNEYMAALLSSVLDSTYKVTEYINECELLNIKVLKPSVNKSFMGFTVDGEQIRFGLLAVKNIGHSLIDRIVETRESDGEYTSLYDFCIRCVGRDLNRRSLECLVLSGALDDLGLNRKQILQSIDEILKIVDIKSKRALSGQLDLFSTGEEQENSIDFNYPDVEEMPKAELLKLEKEVTGLYLTGHPMEAQKEQYKLIKPNTIKDLLEASSNVSELKDNSTIKIMGIITGLNTKITKSGKNMAFIMVEDLYGVVEVLIFPQLLEQCALKLQIDSVIVIEGRLSLREDREPSVLANGVYTTEEAIDKFETSNIALHLRLPDLNGELYNQVLAVLKRNKGKTKVIFYTTLDNKKLLAPQSLWINRNNLLFEQLKMILGDTNISFK